MASYMRSTSTAKRICRWRCVYCGQTNFSLGVITGTAQQSYGSAGVTKEKAAAKAQAAAYEEVVKRIQTVNDEHKIPGEVLINGKCEACSKIQPWAVKTERRALYVILSGVTGFMAGVLTVAALHIFFDQFFPGFNDGMGGPLSILAGFLVGIGAGTGVGTLSRNIAEAIAWKRSGAERQSCHPEILDAETLEEAKAGVT